MKSREFRIGDYVYGLSDNDHSKKKVDTIAVITQYGWETVSGCSAIKAIPIDGRWLVKFGFETNGYEYQIEDWYMGISYDPEFQDWHIYERKDNFHVKTIKYIHELQNIYFAITDKELKLKV